MKHYEVEILDAKTREKLCFLDKVEPHATIAEIKNLFTKSHPQWYPARQSLRLDPKGKSLKDEDVLQKLPVGTTATLYFRDLGAQISWVTVFLTEYTGPLFIYLLFYFRVPFIYGHKYDFTSSRHTVVHLACICHSFHYVKRLLETLFVHRFSHGTMPLRNIFKNCTYYWGFAAWMAYYINHPLYTPPTYGAQQVKLALAIFVICQLGNFSIHMALRDLRPAGEWLLWAWGGGLGRGSHSPFPSCRQDPRPGRSRTPPRTPSRGSSCWCPVPTTPMRWGPGSALPS